VRLLFRKLRVNVSSVTFLFTQLQYFYSFNYYFIVLHIIVNLPSTYNLRKTNCKILSTIRDGARGQANPSLYDKVFVKNDGETTCNLKLITPKYMPLCQPCDFYLCRRIENVMKHLRNCVHFLHEEQAISVRKYAIQLHSLLHQSLEACYCYVWRSSKLTNNRPFS